VKANTALCVGAHPDDGILGMGGLTSLLRSSGWTVHFLTLTCGELCGDPETRQAEERSATAQLGAYARFGMLPDGSFTRHAAIKVVEAVLREITPSLVFVNSPSDTHQDHSAASAAVQSLCWRKINLLFYEGPSTRHFQPNLVVNISDVWLEKERAIRCHGSQVERGNLLDWAHATSLYRSWPRHAGGRCEAFHAYQLDSSLVFGFKKPELNRNSAGVANATP
jgi:LmbE family N-acetylglucosaminyl deacetylase